MRILLNRAIRPPGLAVAFLVSTSLANDSHASEPPPRPNIIFVVADDMGYRDTGYSGNPIAKTPHLDQMAAAGLSFEYFYSAHGTCSPGRMSILTGRTPLRSRMVTTVGPMREGEVTVAAALKTAGYETAHFGKWGVGREGTHPMKVGFDEAVWSKGFYDNGVAFFVNDSDKRDERPVQTTGESSVATVDEALKFIERRAGRKRPFFVQKGRMESRPAPLGFTSGRYLGKEDPTSCEFVTGVWIDGRHMLRLVPVNRRRKEEAVTLYDIIADPAQETNLADQHPDKVQTMRKDLDKWMQSVMASFEGNDYQR